jgi:pimeloyl-ACP methyl ester carboxylesterase
MPVANIDGLDLAYDVIGGGDGTGEPWVVTPGGRFSKDYGGVREMARALADAGKRVLVWDRPNCGASQVCFDGPPESVLQADALAGLLRHLDMAPAVVVAGSGGSRVSLVAAGRHPDVVAKLAVWWISGGPYGLMSLGVHYCGDSIVAAWNGGMEAVVELPEWQEVLTRNPGNRRRFLDLDPQAFVRTLEQWMLAYYPRPGELVPGITDDTLRAFDTPTLVFRSGAADVHHTRATSERLAELIPTAVLAPPPWGDREWLERVEASGDGESLFARWPLLVPPLLGWADDGVVPG